MAITANIPVLTLTDFTQGSPSEQVRFVQGIGQALEQWGFFYLGGHGVSEALVATAYEVAAAVFALPPEVKARYHTPELKGQRGYTPLGQEHAKDHPYPDLKEFWHIVRESATPPNLWPEEVPEFAPTMMALFNQLETCGQVLLRACSRYLTLGDDHLSQWVAGSPTLLRVAHYPQPPVDAHPNSFRAAPHEDINLLTLLWAATAPGLELLQGDGTWAPIEPMAGYLLVDGGDMLENFTNGLFQSVTHRVVTPSPDGEGGDRLSLPFFIHPRPEIDLTPHPACLVPTGGIPRYPSITAKAFLQQRLQEIGLGG